MTKLMPAFKQLLWSTWLCLILFCGFCGAIEMTLKQVEAPIKPFAFYEDGENSGLFYSIGKQIAKQVGYAHEFHIVPWQRIERYMSTSVTDIEISPMYKTISSKRDIVYPAIGELQFGLYTRKDLMQPRGRMLIAVSKTSLPHYQQVFDEDFKLATYEGFSEAIKLLKTEKVDGIVINTLAFDFLIGELDMNKEEYALIWSTSLPLHITRSINSKITMQQLKPVANNLAESDYLGHLIKTCIPQYAKGKNCETLPTDTNTDSL